MDYISNLIKLNQPGALMCFLKYPLWNFPFHMWLVHQNLVLKRFSQNIPFLQGLNECGRTCLPLDEIVHLQRL